MRRTHFSARTVFVLVMTLLSSTLAPIAASASSAYDDYYHTIGDLIGKSPSYANSTCTDEDLTLSWPTKITDPWVATNTGLSETDYNAAKTSLQTALVNGRWGVTQEVGVGYGYSGFIHVYWTEDDSLELSWDTSTATIAAYSPTSDIHTMAVGCLRYLYGTSKNKSIGSYDYYVDSSHTPDHSTGMFYVSGKTNGWKNLFVYTDRSNYPLGYAGEYIREEAPTPVTFPYTGTVNCTGGDPAYMLIYQLGNNGTATLTSVSSGAADWNYNLTSSPYQATVMCGNTLTASVGTVDPLTSSTDWVCDVYANPPYCVLS